PRDAHSFPTRRSSDLGRVGAIALGADQIERHTSIVELTGPFAPRGDAVTCIPSLARDPRRQAFVQNRIGAALNIGAVASYFKMIDRKSTRLNSSHVKI